VSETLPREEWLRQHAERRAAVVRMRAADMSYEDIAAELGGTPNAAKVLMKRARQLGEAPRYDPHSTRPLRRIHREILPVVHPVPHEGADDFVALNDLQLSFKARGLLLHLSVMYPPGTQLNSKELVRPHPDEGISAIRSALRELHRRGYLRRGRGSAWVWLGDPTRRLA
jgi:hypothetical protein